MSFSLYNILTKRAKGLGFVGIGFIRPRRPAFFDHFVEWLNREKNADMHWMKRYVEIREDPAKILKGCSTIICLAYPYSRHIPSTPEGICAARYSEPLKEDYHTRLKRLCKELSRPIMETNPDARIRICVDSAPVLERSLAYMAGIGFIGKNNMLIIPGYGSYLFLAEIFTTCHIPFPDIGPIPEQCGSCTKCINACPTGALSAPHCFDASLCLSYLTIEHKGPIRKEFAQRMKPFFLGCDKCQSVCPFNPKGERYICLPPATEFLDMKEEEFKKTFGKTSLSRAGIEKIKRNIEILLTDLTQRHTQFSA